MKISTLLIKITAITANKIEYISKTDLVPVVYKYYLPADSEFPYSQLEENNWYTLISVRPSDTWYWYYTFNLSKSETLVDRSITPIIEE